MKASSHLFSPCRYSLALAIMWCACVATAGADTFYVSGSGNGTVQRFSAGGANLGSFPTANLTTPTALAFDASGNLYVTDDQPASTIEKYSPAGLDLGTFASTNLSRTYGLAFDSAGNLYAANFGNNTIEKFSPSGADLGAFVSSGVSGPVGLAFDSAGNLYVANYGSDTIAKFSSTGASLGIFASSGLSVPYAIAFDSAGNLYVTNIGSNSVEKFSPTGADLGAFATTNLDGPTGLVFDSSGNLYVCNEDSLTVEKFSAAGADLGVFATAPAGSAPAAIAFHLDAGTLQFTGSVFGVDEDAGTAQITVSRTGGSSGATSVNYATASGSAVAGTDFTAVSGTLSWADGDTSDKSFAVPILDRQISTGSAIGATLTLSQPGGTGTLGSPATAELVISDNDPVAAPTITLTSPPNGVNLVAGTSVTVAAAVADPGNRLSQVQFFINGVLSLTIGNTGGPYVDTVDLAKAGTYEIEAVATGIGGQQSTSTHTVTVVAPTVSAPAPGAATILTALNGLQLAQGSTVTITAAVNTAVAGKPLKRVTFYANGVAFASFDGAGNPITTARAPDGQPVRRATATPVSSGSVFQAAFQVPAITQPVTIIAVATSEAGLSQVSAPVTVQPAAVTGTQPTIKEEGVTSGKRVAAGVALKVPVTIERASAAITKVQYYLNGLEVAGATKPPYEFSVKPPTAGSYVLTTIATDSAGVSIPSTPIVIDALPVVSLSVQGGGIAVAGGEKAKVVFKRTDGSLSSPLTVYYTLSGAAVNGVNYQRLSKKVTIPAKAETYVLKIAAIDTHTGPDKLKAAIKLAPSPNSAYEEGTADEVKVSIEQTK